MGTRNHVDIYFNKKITKYQNFILMGRTLIIAHYSYNKILF